MGWGSFVFLVFFLVVGLLWGGVVVFGVVVGGVFWGGVPPSTTVQTPPNFFGGVYFCEENEDRGTTKDIDEPFQSDAAQVLSFGLWISHRTPPPIPVLVSLMMFTSTTVFWWLPVDPLAGTP